MKLGSSKSIRSFLLKLSQSEGLIFQQLVTRYLHERLLYRLSVSEYRHKFILKGGNLLYALESINVRPTVDIDILAKHIINDKEKLKRIFTDICSIRYDDDCINFDTSNITASDIAEEIKYSGIRLLILAKFDTIQQFLQIDIGFGDIIIPEPVLISYPTLVSGLNSPDIMTYSIETVIAEKFHAMIQHSIFNSRMKDFYDVYILLKNNKIDKQQLQFAILQTFKHRNTFFDINHPLFTVSFYTDQNRLTMGKAFLRKINISEELDFSVVVKSILEQLEPIYKQITMNN